MTQTKSKFITAGAVALLCFTSVPSIPTLMAQTTDSQTAPDNTAANKNQRRTADSQDNSKADRMMAAQVRRAIIADKSLSMYAHNVKIIVLNGGVLLKGPVRSEDEKAKVAADAASVVSADKITNKLTVK